MLSPFLVLSFLALSHLNILRAVKDRCQYGDDCTYRHDTKPEGGVGEAKKSLICQFFLKGKCRHRSKCYFLHPLRPCERSSIAITGNTNCTAIPSKNAIPGLVEIDVHSDREIDFSTRTPQKDSNLIVMQDQGKRNDSSNFFGADKCCVCMKIVVHKGCRFALYENCSHCVCFDCAKTNHTVAKNSMREAGVHVGNILINHFCPSCFVESDSIIPSKYFHIGNMKDQFITDYKLMRADRPCKFFRTGVIGSCPFGSNCFYAHYDLDGTDIKLIDFPLPKGAGPTVKRFVQEKGSNSSSQKKKYVLHNLLTRRF